MLAASLFLGPTHTNAAARACKFALRSKVHYHASSAAHQITSTQPLDSVHFRRSSISVQARTSGIFPNPSGHLSGFSDSSSFDIFIGYNPTGPATHTSFPLSAVLITATSTPRRFRLTSPVVRFGRSQLDQISRTLLQADRTKSSHTRPVVTWKSPSCKRELPHCSLSTRSICLLRFCDTANYNDDFRNTGNQHTRVATQQPSRHIRKDAYRSVESPGTLDHSLVGLGESSPMLSLSCMVVSRATRCIYL